MNKTIYIVLIATILISSSMIAAALPCIKPVQKVEWYDYARDMGYNMEGDLTYVYNKFQNVCLCYEREGNLPDVYGQILKRWDGSFCMVGGNSRRNKVEDHPLVSEVVEPIVSCQNKTTCKWEWVREYECDNEWTCHHQCWKPCNWHYEEVCDWEWHKRKVCETETICTSTS